jgi:predicted DCC family thiol-disulfide oxidoreductase YuxK
LPDSVVVLSSDGLLLARSNAVIYLFGRLGGGWRALAGIMRVIPRPVRDAAYDFIARVRYRIFGRRDDVCPIVPPRERLRFDP